MDMDLVAFLRARLDEWEAGATATMLRVVAAMRAIVDLLEAAEEHDDTSLGVATLRAVAKTLAGIWRDHPDYDRAWGTP